MTKLLERENIRHLFRASTVITYKKNVCAFFRIYFSKETVKL